MEVRIVLSPLREAGKAEGTKGGHRRTSKDLPEIGSMEEGGVCQPPQHKQVSSQLSKPLFAVRFGVEPLEPPAGDGLGREGGKEWGTDDT